MDAPRIVFLLGFDRSGSSMVARMLARHPDVDLLFHPFNSTEVTKRQWEVWDPSEEVPATESFLAGLLEGEIREEYLASDWFRNHSTTDRIRPGALTIVKDTKLHFKLPWLRARFPGIPVHGIRRDPRAILSSLMRNDFYTSWYGPEAFEQAAAVVRGQGWAEAYRPFLEEMTTDTRRMALMVAIRTDFLFTHLEPGHVIDYAAVLTDPDAALNGWLDPWDLPPYRFAVHLEEDHNVVGRPFEGADLWRTYFPPDEIAFLDRLFARIHP